MKLRRRCEGLVAAAVAADLEGDRVVVGFNGVEAFARKALLPTPESREQ